MIPLDISVRPPLMSSFRFDFWLLLLRKDTALEVQAEDTQELGERYWKSQRGLVKAVVVLFVNKR